MAYDVNIAYAEGLADLTLNGLVKAGDLLAYDGSTGYVQADASDAATNLYAQFVAMQAGAAGDKIKGCRRCILHDEDAPYTAGQMQYLSATAGAHTATRPTTAADVIQVVGLSLSTKQVQIDIKQPTEVEVFIPCPPYNDLGASVEAHAADGTTNEWAGADCDSAAVCAVFTGYFPAGMVGNPIAADLIINTQAATAADVDFTYVAASPDSNAANTGDAGATQTAQTTSETTADNKIMKVSCVTGMDADFSKAGYVFGVAVDPDAGDFLVLGLRLRFMVV